jgi:hypothetical protein
MIGGARGTILMRLTEAVGGLIIISEELNAEKVKDLLFVQKPATFDR